MLTVTPPLSFRLAINCQRPLYHEFHTRNPKSDMIRWLLVAIKSNPPGCWVRSRRFWYLLAINCGRVTVKHDNDWTKTWLFFYIGCSVIISGVNYSDFVTASVAYFTAQTSWHTSGKTSSIWQFNIDRWPRFGHRTIIDAFYPPI